MFKSPDVADGSRKAEIKTFVHISFGFLGNVVKDKVNGNVRNFVFNGDNKQVHVKDANNNPIGTYYYDGNGARVKKSVDGNTTIFVYDAARTLVAEYTTEALTTTPTVSYTTTDHLGSPRVITDKQGNVTSRRDFMPFGEELNADVGNTYRKTADKYSQYGIDNIRKRFTGYEKDNETNLDFAEARYYNNKHGRFTAVDPLLASGKSSNPQTFNRFVYCLNNPINCTDPSGLDPWYQQKQADGSYHYQTFATAPTEGDWTATTFGSSGYLNIGDATQGGRDIGNTYLYNDGGLHDGTRARTIRSLMSNSSNPFAISRSGNAPGASSPNSGILFRGNADFLFRGIGGGGVNFVGSVADGVNSVLSASQYLKPMYLGCAGGGPCPTPMFAPTPRIIPQSEEEKFVQDTTAYSLFALSMARGGMPRTVAPNYAGFSTRVSEFPPIKVGSYGGSSAFGRIGNAVKREAIAENPKGICVFCRQENATQFDHAWARSKGGNATIQNTQRICAFCNPSKGAGQYPKNPAPGYQGQFPPPWWK